MPSTPDLVGPHPRRRPLRSALFIVALLVSASLAGCDDEALSSPDAGVTLPERFVIGVIEPAGGMPGKLPELDVAVDRINAAGGIGGQAPLALRRIAIDGLDGSAVDVARTLVDDPEVVAIIGPGRPDAVLDVATAVVDGGKPFLTGSATSGELQRAFSGSPFVWRTKTSDIGQMEFILRRASNQGVERIGLLTGLGASGQSFFNWFGFYATNLGFDADDVYLAAYTEDVRPESLLPDMLDADLDMLVIAPERPMDAEILAEGLAAARDADGRLPFRVVLADTGLDLPTTVAGQPDMVGFEGWVTTSTEASALPDVFAAAGVGMPSDAASGHDAVLLLAYALEASAGATGEALANAIAAVVAGDGEVFPPTDEGIAQTLEALRRGERPDIQGTTGTLAFDPVDGVDLEAPTIGHWSVSDRGPAIRFVIDERIDLAEQGGLQLRRARPMFTAPTAGDIPPPASRPTRIVALILAASSSWDNYRHQADALRQYQRLRGLGVSDDDIVMVGADDLADHPDNALPGVVRNVPGGPDLRADVVYDYETLSPRQIDAVLRGEESAETPIVLPQAADAALFVYFAGHGGIVGLAIDANSTEDGLFASDASTVLQPQDFTETLCALRAAGRMPQATIVIESCHAGVFGDADFFGIESGCADGETRLENVLLLTAANSLENSLATGYDRELQAWVGDEFSVAFSDRVEQVALGDMLSVYRDIYESVSGSHVSLYNSDLNPDLGTLPADRVLLLRVGGDAAP